MNNSNSINLTGDNHSILKWIWKNLIPKSGQANSIQGELLRAVEKLRYEAQNNGNINWENGFEILIDFIDDKLTTENSFNKEDKAEIKKKLSRLRNFITPNQLQHDSDKYKLPYIKDDLYDRLEDFIVEYCKVHPELILLR